LWGGTSGTFAGLDLFSRIIDQRWQNDITGTPADIDRYKYGYDLNSNRLWKGNVVGTAAVTAGLDEFYTNDTINRLTDMQRGVLNGTNTGITGTPSVEQDWTLDPTGNWSNFVTSAAGTTTLNQTRTANTVNEITNITETTGPTWVVPEYDLAGNMITMPQPASPTSSFSAVYDAWNRMVSISVGSDFVGQYQYDGRNFRIVKDTYTSGTLSETRHLYYTSNWQDIEERVGTSTDMDQQYVWGIRYIDELVCRDDATPQRLYATLDANFNLTGINNSSGDVAERYVFDPYGNRTIMNSAWSTIGTSGYNWVVGHQGLMIDIESRLIYNRNRVLNSALGRFHQWDRVGYGDGMDLYEYEISQPIRYQDPTGKYFVCAGITAGITVLAPITSGATAGAASLGLSPSVSLYGCAGYNSVTKSWYCGPCAQLALTVLAGPGAFIAAGGGPAVEFNVSPSADHPAEGLGVSVGAGAGAAPGQIGVFQFLLATSASLSQSSAPEWECTWQFGCREHAPHAGCLVLFPPSSLIVLKEYRLLQTVRGLQSFTLPPRREPLPKRYPLKVAVISHMISLRALSLALGIED
jgi:RHS repeat-associated protein